MMELLEEVSKTGITVLVVTHEHELVHRFHQRVVTIESWQDRLGCACCTRGGTPVKLSTFGFLTGRGLRNLGTHWAMTIACVASLAVCMSLNTLASLVEVNVDSMIGYLGRQNETVVFLDPNCDDATATAVGEQISAISGVTHVSYMSKQDVLDTYEGYLDEQYETLWDEFESDNPFKANYRVTVGDLSQLSRISSQMEKIPGVVKVTAPVEMGSIFCADPAGGHPDGPGLCAGADGGPASSRWAAPYA